MSNGSIEIDESHKPIMLVRVRGVTDDPTFHGYLRTMDGWLRRGDRYLLILDARGAGATPRQQQRAQAEWIRNNREALVDTVVGSVFVIESALTRFILSAILLIQRPPNDYVVVDSMAEGVAWAAKRLSKAGVPLTSDVHQIR